MRDIADKFVGGIERIDVDLPASRGGPSLRAVLLGTVGVALLSVAEPYNQNVFENTMLIGNQLPAGVLFIVLMLVLVVNPVLTLLPRSRSAFDPARLVVTWICLLPASLVMWRGPVERGVRVETMEGLAGPAVGLVWGLTGLLLLGTAIAAHYRRSEGVGSASERGPVPPKGTLSGTRIRSALVLAAVCLVPIALAPVFVGWFGSAPPAQSAGLMALILKYGSLTLLMLLVGWVASRLLARVEPLAPAELVVIATMMLVACGVIWSGFHRLWSHQLVAPFYLLKSHERWRELVESLPGRLVPSADPQNVDVVYNFYRDTSTVPWLVWGWTALKWCPFVLSFFVGLLFLMALFRRQWEEAEKLSFPLATIALETLRPPRRGRLLNEMLGSRLFWWSTGLVVLLQTIYGLHVYFDQVPEIVFKYDLHAALETPPWRHLPHWIRAKDAFFAAVGVAFFLSTEMSFSLWSFVIILGVVEMVGKNFQYSIHEHFDDHQIGAYIAYGAVIIWVARHHLSRAFRSIWQRRARLEDEGQLSERSAAIGFVVCFAIACSWLVWAGLPVHVAILVALVIFLLSLVIARVVAESGLLFVQYQCWPHRFAEATFPQLLTPKTHALIHFTTIAPTMDAREGLMPYAFNAARMADGVERLAGRRSVFGLWVGSLVLALVLAGAAQLFIVYRAGKRTDEHAGRMLPEQTYNSSADFADLAEQPAERISAVRSQHTWRVGTGGFIVLALCLLRYRFLAWPLHPIGFIMAHTYPMRVFWLSIMIGWLCKTLVMRLGGVPVYRTLRPAFLGMIVGTTFSSMLWILVKIASYSGGEEGRAILFLPS